MDQLGDLADMLTRMFSDKELEYVATAISGTGRNLKDELDLNQSKQDIAYDLVEKAHARGLVNDAFFAHIKAERSTFIAEIEQARLRFCGAGAVRVVGERFRLDERLSKHGDLELFKAYDLLVGIDTAVRLFPMESDADLSTSGLIRAAKIQMGLRHCHVQGTSDVGYDKAAKMAFLALPWCENSLSRLVRTSGRVDPDNAVRIVGQVADALDYLHGEAMVHRAVRPSHVGLVRRARRGRSHGEAAGPQVPGVAATDGWDAVLMDFRQVRHGSGEDPALSELLEGSWAWIAPEVRMDPSRATAKSDVYGLGATLFFALTGKVPVDLHDSHDDVRKPQLDLLEALWGTDQGRRVRRIVRRATLRSPEDRLSLADFTLDLQTLRPSS